ncbi:unnamed protein product [Echinostoma caproni]|uniref:Uncharacterized protein n=1 Tax=Echinostoma caproni TaxID=27848 RepID=A0A183AAN3_9TREM|nr:unnamed protein product [Echinostoma caproni]
MQQRKLPPRSQCIIVVNPTEAEATATQARLDYHLQLLRSHMVTLFDGDEVEPAASIRVNAAFRLGKPRQDNSPRPLKVVLRAEGEAKAIFQRTHKLKGTPARFLKDLGSDQRSKMKTALEELMERRAKGETDLCIRDFPVTKCYERVDDGHVAVLELLFLSARVSLFECWRTTPIRKDLEKPCGAEASFVTEGIPQLE